MSESNTTAPSRLDPAGHQRGADKMARVRVKFEPTQQPLRKPAWIRTRVHNSPRVQNLTALEITGAGAAMPVIAGKHHLTQIWCTDGDCQG